MEYISSSVFHINNGNDNGNDNDSDSGTVHSWPAGLSSSVNSHNRS